MSDAQQQEQNQKQQQQQLQQQEQTSKQQQEQASKSQTDPQQQEQASKQVMELQQKVAEGMIFVGAATVENEAGFVMSFSVTDGENEVSSERYPAGEARRVDLAGLRSHCELRLTVHAEEGPSREADQRLVFVPEQPEARFRVTGTALIYNVELLG